MSISDQSAANPSKARQLTTEVRLAPQFVNRMCARLETAEARTALAAGLLYGTHHGPLVVVQAFRSLIESELAAIEVGKRPLDDAVRELMRGAQNDAAIAPLELVGWYSFRALSGFKDQDARFHERVFPGKDGIALIVRRGDGAFLLFDFYGRTEEGILSAQQYLNGGVRFSPAQATTGIVDIRLQNRTNRGSAMTAAAGSGAGTVQRPEAGSAAVAVLAPIERPQIQQAQTRAAAAQSIPTLTPLRVNSRTERASLRGRRRRSRFPWLVPALLFTAAATLTFAFLLLPGLQRTRVTTFAVVATKGLNLHVETQGERVLLTWDRNNPLAKSAASGVLHIDDGNLHRDVQLDGTQVANGAVLYKPNTDDVDFRLQVQGQNGNVLAEDLRLLDGTGHATPVTDITAISQRVTDSAKTQPPPAPLESQLRAPLKDTNPTSTRPDLLATNRSPGETSSSPVSSPPPAEPSRASIAESSATPPQNTKPNPPPLAAPTEIPTLHPESAPAHSTDRTVSTAPTLQIAPEPKQETPSAANTEPAHATQPDVAKPQAQAPAPTPSQVVRVPTLPFAQRYVPPKPIQQVLPNISALPSSMLVTASRVTIVVEVDQNGRVTSAQPQTSTEKVARPVIQAAQMAAKQWIFQPARLDGKPVAAEHSIVFQFGR